MIHLIRILFVLFFGLTSIAQGQPSSQDTEKTKPKIYSYNYWLPVHMNDYFQKLFSNEYLQNLELEYPEGQNQCQSPFKNALKNEEMNIHYALGYFDDSQGVDILYDGFNYGLSPSLDIEVFHALRKMLTSDCRFHNQALCQFKESGNPDSGLVELTKKMKVFGQKMNVRIHLTYASASESFNDNKTILSSQQKVLTLQSEKNFFDQIGKADVVIYNGHSRDGGGPDFNPPILNKKLKTDYDGYYRVKKIGINKVLKNLKASTNKESVLGLFACYSHLHYYNSLMKVNPKLKVVLSTDTIDYFDSMNASLGFLEGLLKGFCGEEINQYIQQDEKLKKGYKAFNL